MKQWKATSQGTQRTRSSQGTQRTRSLQKELRNLINNQDDTAGKSITTKKTRLFFITNGFKNYKITHITRPNELVTTTSKVSKRSPDTTRLWNDYVLQIATR